jgi:hypothetical protein
MLIDTYYTACSRYTLNNSENLHKETGKIAIRENQNMQSIWEMLKELTGTNASNT